MYPRRAVRELARRKARLRESIAARRTCVARAASRVLAPLRWWVLARLWWARVSPIVKPFVPGGAGRPPTSLPRRKWAERLQRWLPAAVAALRLLRSLRTARRREVTGATC